MKITVKAAKLKTRDRIRFGGVKYKITNLTRTFGNSREDQVRLMLTVPGSNRYTSISVPASMILKINRKK